MDELWKNLRDIWGGLSRAGRVALLACIAVIAIGVSVALVWAYRSNDEVLFSDLDPRDAAAIVDELKKMKVPYRIGDDDSRILVDAKSVREVRLSLMARGVPITGGVGFEIFDNKDMGMTESIQKINYQRALQGELSRTIMANDQLRSARVHLVVEEGGLFARDKTQPKAAVSVVLKPAAHLANEQILGIQRLVAAAVPGLEPTRVTITDQRGIALSADADTDSDAGSAAATGKLRLKKQADEYLTQKVASVLDRTFGQGQAIVSVDATLNFDEIKRTEQNILPVAGHAPEVGAVVRHRESVYRQPGAATSVVKAVDTGNDPPDGHAASAGTLTSTNETEYELGKSAEQILSTPGGIRRISVGVIVPQALNDDQLSRVREIVRMTVGFNSDRGDAITVQPLGSIVAAMHAAEPIEQPPPVAAQAPRSARTSGIASNLYLGVAAAVLLAVCLMVAIVWRVRLARRVRAAHSRLSDRERQQLLREVQALIEAGRNQASGAMRG
jgi:flagellar M-ring protein FliF